MLKRTNEFQKLIFILERHLADMDVADVRVTESKLVIDQDGISREIDVALKGTIADHTILIAIECRDHKRNADLK